ncbi:putative MFS-type transporter [Streptomyces sp. RB5]|uniref:Putative MFS-type transporter n=1 Tax=Streptomyces smaragdinus TaxID=2585196 RepID=A0A7K0CGZ6_9ACTN|nr:MFS transporter [Streptomyces smaragdinus]MQY12656.1 putative MFS-type transporter [Streptomyces smaragdinus]
MSLVHDLRTLLGLGAFRKLLAVRLLSQLADGVFQVALATYVVFSPEKQTSAASIASAMAVLLLPYSLVGPFAGVLLDRWSRRQVLFYGNLVRAVFAAATAVLVAAAVPDALFLLCALCVTAVNRFILSGLSAALPRVVDTGEQLVMGNSLSPTAGTLAATSGAAVGFVVSLAGPEGHAADAITVFVAGLLYLCAGLASLRFGRDRLGPDPEAIPPRLRTAVAGTARGLVAGLRHLAQRPVAARALGSMAVMRFCYGALTVTVLMLCRYAWTDDNTEAMALLGVAVGVSGAGFFAAAVITPWAVARLGPLGWITMCAGAAAVLVTVLGLPFARGTVLAAAFVLGLATQGAKISTDTVVQTAVADDHRGRVFSLYDMLFNIAFVGAAAVSALMLPPDGRSATLILTVAALYAAVAWVMFHTARPAPVRVSRET